MTEDRRTDLAAVTRWLDLRVPPGLVLVGALGLVLAISAGDFLTGPYLVFATFYLVPVVATAWFVGRTPALAVALLASASGVASTALDPGEVGALVIALNGSFRFITYAFVVLLVTGNRRTMEAIRDMSGTDPLTRLPNRGRFFAEAELELARAARSGTPLAVIYLDVDDLKLCNDTYGHLAGDEMLVEFAEAARHIFRSTDLVARIGGDEFCVIMPGADLFIAEEATDRFVVALERASRAPVRVSAGIVAGPVDAALDVETLVHDADALMYQAKTSGKGQRRSRPSLRIV